MRLRDRPWGYIVFVGVVAPVVFFGTTIVLASGCWS